MTNADGDSYCGGYKEGVYHGFGVYTFVNGDCYAGKWIDGRFVGVASGAVNATMLLHKI